MRQVEFLSLWCFGGGPYGEGGPELLISDETEKHKPLHPTHPNLKFSSLRCALISEETEKRPQLSKQSLPFWEQRAV